VPLSVGTHFGAYEFIGELGAGGMGEVYRAFDTNLKREVALKVLPADVVGDADRLARFQREAEVLAALNHPNIALIFGIEKAAGTTALIMELIDGPTLADRIALGPIPANESLNIAMQIAAALEAAHGRQIVHRDLKPANIKLRPDGTVKVLDFGIAKALETAEGPTGPQAPSLTTPAMTQAGIILGTAAYMAPEQARGKTVDARADIWAFGCVLYEMLTGQPAFGGEDVPMTLARVLANDADLESIPRAVAPSVAQTIDLCLQKEVDKRIADIRDVRLALTGAFESRIFGPQDAAKETTSGASRWLWPAIAAALAITTIADLWAPWRATPTPPEERHLQLRFPPNVDSSFEDSFAVSPDGRHLVIAARSRDDETARNTQPRLWLRSFDSLELTPLPGTEGVFRPFWSPDSLHIGFTTTQGERLLKSIDLTGAPARTIPAGDGVISDGAWSEDGAVLFRNAENGLSFVPASGGTPVAVTESEAGLLHHELPAFLPGGRNFIYFQHATEDSRSGIYLGSLATAPADQPKEALLFASDGPRWVTNADGRTGFIVYQVDDALLAQPFDAATLQMTGAAVRLVAGVYGGEGGGLFSASADGAVLVYREGIARGRRRVPVWVDRDGSRQSLNLPPGNYDRPRTSPDGRRIAFERSDGRFSIWIWDLNREALTLLTPGPGQSRGAVWTPDGTRIAFTRAGDAIEAGIYWQPADGSGSPELLLGEDLFARAFTPDGRFLIIESNGTSRDISVLDLEGTRARVPLLDFPFNESNPEISPDGRWLAYESDESGIAEIYVRPFPNVAASRTQISVGGGTAPRWGNDGRELFYWVTPGTLMAVPVSTEGAFSAGRPETILEGSYVGANYRQYDISGDGERFLLIASSGAEADENAGAFQILLNGFDKLR